MNKVYVEVTKQRTIKAKGCIYITDFENKEVPPNIRKEQLEENNKTLYPLIKECGTDIFKGLASIVALAGKGYKVSFKEFKETQDGI